MACIRLSVPENSDQRSAFVVGSRIGSGSGNTLGTKRARTCIGTAWRESGNEANPRLGREELCANIEHHRCTIQTSSPALPRKNEAADKDGRPKSEDSTHQYLSSQKCGVRGLSEGRGWWWKVSKINKVGAQEESKGRRGGRDGKRESKGTGSMEEGETGGTRKDGREGGTRKEGERNGGGTKEEEEMRAKEEGMDGLRLTAIAYTGSPNRATFPAFHIPPPRQHRGQCMAQHESKEREQDNAVDERREGPWALEVERGREVWAEEREENMRRESEEQAEEEHAQGRGGVDAQRSQMLTSSTLDINDLGPRTKDGLGQAGEERAMAGGRMGSVYVYPPHRINASDVWLFSVQPN
ncbi:hypothetical protein B0H13DRAFT_1879849 [Mycena leptocephala]|nr:hypothetical protein B0H13DRAFT_1879849 [Mycena leptocephala]